MSRYAVSSIVTAFVVVGLAIGAVLLGQGLLPTKVEAIEKGTIMPWYIVWAMISATSLCAIVLAGSLLITGVKGLSGDNI
jgi:hypothetical protein